MKQNSQDLSDGGDKELLKAVAQAWHAQAGEPQPTKESDAHKSNFKHRPSRFKLEAMTTAFKSQSQSSNWDFAQSLWDSYEIVTLSKKLEAGLAMDGSSDPVEAFSASGRVGKRPRESRNSLRRLFFRVSSKRFDCGIAGGDEDDPEP